MSMDPSLTKTCPVSVVFGANIFKFESDLNFTFRSTRLSLAFLGETRPVVAPLLRPAGRPAYLISCRIKGKKEMDFDPYTFCFSYSSTAAAKPTIPKNPHLKRRCRILIWLILILHQVSRRKTEDTGRDSARY